MLFDRKGESRPLALAKSDRADAYEQLPLRNEDEHVAAVTLKNPTDGPRYSYIPRTQLSGSAASFCYYNCFSRVISSLACAIFKIPRIGY